MNNKEFNEVIEKLNLLTKEISEIKQVMNYENFIEKSTIEKCETLMSHIIEKLFEIAFSSNVVFDHNKEKWGREIKNYQSIIKDELLWYSNTMKTSYLDTIINHMDNIYDSALRNYKDELEKYPDIGIEVKRFPEECPWTAEDLISKTIKYLIPILYQYYSIKEEK
jgi:hypothetical protein